MAGTTVGLEELVGSVVFHCPCEGHFAYGLAFLWVPAMLLFLAGILVDRDLWKFATICNRRRTKYPTFRYLKALFLTPYVFIRACIAPAAWLVLSFLRQQYYTCAYFGPPLVDKDATKSNTTDRCLRYFEAGTRSEQLEERYKTHSQIAGWSLLLIVVSTLFTSICIRRCLKKAKQLEIPSLEYYRHIEAKEALVRFHIKAKEIAKESAERSVEKSFEKVENKDFDERIKEVSHDVYYRYGLFFIIPESPAFHTPEGVAEKAPQFLPCAIDATDNRPSFSNDQNSGKILTTCECQHKPRQAVSKVSLHRQNAVTETTVWKREIQEKWTLHVNAKTNRGRQFRNSLFIAKTLWLTQLYERESRPMLI